MILHTEFLVVCRGWKVEHVFAQSLPSEPNFFSIRIRLFEIRRANPAEAQ